MLSDQLCHARLLTSMATSPSYNQDTAALFSSTQGEVSRSTEGPSAAEWEARKDDIRRLYEKHPLKTVRTYLEEHYGFRATCVPR